MDKKTLVILAAGIGSRFGEGIKQLEPVDDQDHLIIDYSIHDAIKAGFNKIVFIIRHEIEADFRERIGDRIEKLVTPRGVEIAYAYQEKETRPTLSDELEEQVKDRTKPWGTGHAILCAADVIDSAFAIINADDYYGLDGYKKAVDFLSTNQYALVGYVLKNTLSDNGGVTRGVCTVEDGKLVAIDETKNIMKTPAGAEADGKVLDLDSLVSMNFWCCPLEFLDILRNGFPEFLATMKDPLKDEYLLPIIADGMLKEGVKFSVLPTQDQWFGVTYKSDMPGVIECFKKLHEEGVYGQELYADL